LITLLKKFDPLSLSKLLLCQNIWQNIQHEHLMFLFHFYKNFTRQSRTPFS